MRVVFWTFLVSTDLVRMKKIVVVGVTITALVSCTTVEETRKREPAFKATANQAVIEFRDCESPLIC
jgi:acyl dehydratase